MFAYVAWSYDSDLWEWYVAITFGENDEGARMAREGSFKLTGLHSGERFKKLFPGIPKKIQLGILIS
jgi:hypothetical protein